MNDDSTTMEIEPKTKTATTKSSKQMYHTIFHTNQQDRDEDYDQKDQKQ